MFNFSSPSILTTIQVSARLGLALVLLSTGSMMMPAQAQDMGVNAISAATAPAAKAQIFVNSNTGKDDASAGRNESTPIKTISYALSLATPGTVVQVASGLYSQSTGETFPLVVPQGVTVQGNEFNQGGTVIVQGGGRFASSWWGSQDVAFLAKANSQIVGFTVTNPNSRGTGVWIESADVTVRGCTFAKSAREGVFTAGKANPTIENNLFVENSANGVAMTGLSTGMVRNNLFQNTGFGLAVSEKASPQLINNRVQGNVDGIVVSHSATPQLRGNIVEGSRRDGLVVISQASPDLGSAAAPGRNIFRNNGRYAIYNAGAGSAVSVQGNDVNGSVQMTALSPTAEPEDSSSLQASAPSTPSVAAPQAAITPVKAAKVAATQVASTASPSRELKKASTVQYKGKTYILLEDVVRLVK